MSFFGSAYYSCALPAMIDDWRLKLNRPLLPFLLVELAAYCNEHGASTFESWCDQNVSAINKTDYNLPDMRATQGKSTRGRTLVFVETAADLGSVHPLMGSIHPAAKQELGARLALAAKASAIAVARQDYSTPPADPSDEVLWEGPTAVVAYPTASGDIEVVFNSSGGLALNASAACPPAMLASPLGRMTCNGAGFELNLNGGTMLVASATIKPGHPNTIVLRPAAGQNISGISPRNQDSVRYAWADWPVCSVRNAKSSGGSTTVPLPARIFDMSICGTDRCPGVMCPVGIKHCPPATTTTVMAPTAVAQKTDDSFLHDELAGTTAAVGSVLAARAEVAVAPPPPPENFIPASSPSCWYTGRTQVNEDGSRSFDWEGTQLWVNVQGASYIKMVRDASVPL